MWNVSSTSTLIFFAFDIDQFIALKCWFEFIPQVPTFSKLAEDNAHIFFMNRLTIQ